MISNKEKAALLKMFEELLKNGRIARIRVVIEKFKQNRKITDIQRCFLKGLLMLKDLWISFRNEFHINSGRDQSSNLSMSLWVARRRCTTDSTPSLRRPE